jgi:hypothetical protein
MDFELGLLLVEHQLQFCRGRLHSGHAGEEAGLGRKQCFRPKQADAAI